MLFSGGNRLSTFVEGGAGIKINCWGRSTRENFLGGGNEQISPTGRENPGMCCQMCTYVPSGGRVHLFFFRGQWNVPMVLLVHLAPMVLLPKQEVQWKKKDTVRYLKTFRIVSNETPASSLRPCWWYLVSTDVFR